MGYPKRFILRNYGCIVEFTALSEGTVIAVGTSNNILGAWHDDWIAHTDSSRWQPVKSKRQALHNMIGSFNGKL